jgi:hypothetical protein
VAAWEKGRPVTIARHLAGLAETLDFPVQTVMPYLPSVLKVADMKRPPAIEVRKLKIARRLRTYEKFLAKIERDIKWLRTELGKSK